MKKTFLFFAMLLLAGVAVAATTIQLRRDTAANWTTNNPTLYQGEIGIETDTKLFKMGNGTTAWTLLPYANLINKCTTIAAATSSSDYMMERIPQAMTIRAVHITQLGATNVVGHMDKCDANGINCVGVDGATDITATTTTANDDGSLSNPSIDAGTVIAWHTTSVSGTNIQVMVCYEAARN